MSPVLRRHLTIRRPSLLPRPLLLLSLLPLQNRRHSPSHTPYLCPHTYRETPTLNCLPLCNSLSAYHHR